MGQTGESPMAKDQGSRRGSSARRIAVGAVVAAALVGAGCSSSKTKTADTTVVRSDTTAVGDTATTVAGADTTVAAGTTAAADTTAVAAATTVASGSSGSTGSARELVIARSMDINSLDVSRSYCDTCQIFNTAVYETLITADITNVNTLLPRLATKWEANPDNTQFTFTLNPAAKFADGSAVEAKDVKWSWERLGNLKGSASYLIGGTVSIEVPDAATVVVKFKAPNSAFLQIAAASYMGVINSDVATTHEASAAVGADTADKAEPWFLKNSAGSGPYTLASYTQGDALVLAANTAYWGATKPRFPKITIKEVKDAASQLQQLQQGDVDIAMQLAIDSLPQLEGDTKVVATPVDSFNYVYVAFSPGAKGAENMADVKVRQAMRLAIDFDGAIDTLVAGKGKKQASPIPNGFIGSKALALPAQDLTKAKALMTEAGKAAGFSVDATYPKGNVYGVDFDLMMQKVQQDLKAIKVDIKLNPVEIGQWADIVGKQGIPVTAVYFAPDHGDSSQYPQYFAMMEGSSWAARAGGGKAGKPIINPKEAPLLATALAASGPAKEKAYTDLGQEMINDAVIVPIVNPQVVLAYAADITNMHYSACCNLDLGLLGLKN